MNELQTLLSSLGQRGTALPAQSPGRFAIPPSLASSLAPPEPEVVTVVGERPPGYGNIRDIQRVQAALDEAPAVKGGGPNPGLYGLLPESWQQGTFRNIMGALGDAFLVGSGRDPIYGPRMERREVGSAMAGFHKDPAMAASRVAMTGAEGSPDLALEMFNQAQQQDLKRQGQQQTDIYRDSLAHSREVGAIQRMAPYVGGMFQGVKTKEDYQRKWNQADILAKRINPDFTPADFGLPDPEDWQPQETETLGATTGQVMRRDTSRESIDQRRESAQQSSADRRYSTNVNSADRRAAIAQRQAAAKQSSADRRYSVDNRASSSSSSGTRAIPKGLEVKGAAPQAQTAKKYTPGEAQKLAKGTQYQGTDGNWYIR